MSRLDDDLDEEDDEGGESDGGDPLLGDDVVLVGATVDASDVLRLEAALAAAQHLKPQWERIQVGARDGKAVLGLPLLSRATEDAVDNHARHLVSLLSLLGVPLAGSHSALRKFDLHRSELRALRAPPVRHGRKAS
jgi:hypothetical protein